MTTSQMHLWQPYSIRRGRKSIPRQNQMSSYQSSKDTPTNIMATMEGEAEVSVLGGGTVPLGRKERGKERDILNKSKVKCASMFCNKNIYFCNFFSSVRFYSKLPSCPVLYVFSNT
jgi:hypothetical protein